jgi:hypothetical protein
VVAVANGDRTDSVSACCLACCGHGAVSDDLANAVVAIDDRHGSERGEVLVSVTGRMAPDCSRATYQGSRSMPSEGCPSTGESHRTASWLAHRKRVGVNPDVHGYWVYRCTPNDERNTKRGEWVCGCDAT